MNSLEGLSKPDAERATVAHLMDALRLANAEINHPGYARSVGRDIATEMQTALDMGNKVFE